MSFLHWSLIPLGFSGFPIFQNSWLKCKYLMEKSQTHTHTHRVPGEQTRSRWRLRKSRGVIALSLSKTTPSPQHRDQWIPTGRVSAPEPLCRVAVHLGH